MGYKELTKQAEGFTTDEDLTLQEGTRYKIKLTTSNRAGLKTVHKTDGVVVDVSPPEVKFKYVCNIPNYEAWNPFAIYLIQLCFIRIQIITVILISCPV